MIAIPIVLCLFAFISAVCMALKCLSYWRVDQDDALAAPTMFFAACAIMLGIIATAMVEKL